MPRIDVNGAKLSYRVSGAASGRPVLLLHGSAGSSAQWRALGGELAARYRVLALDLYGYGASDPWPGRRALALADEAALAEALIERCDRPVHLIGHSYGGAVALRTALKRPERIATMTLIEPVAFNLLRDGGAAERALLGEVGELASTVAEGARSGDAWGAMAAFVDYWTGPGAWSRAPVESRARLAAQVHKVTQDFHAVFTDPVALVAYRWLRIPALLVSGAASPAPVRRIAELLSAALPDARQAVVQGAGHMLPLSHAGTLGALIRGHHENVEAAAKRAA
jgi:pimeloyl-ACP methyl ester carboxylesterase